MTDKEKSNLPPLTSDGELWSIPDPEELAQLRIRQLHAIDEQNQRTEQLTHSKEQVMFAIIKQLTELNLVYKDTMYLELRDGQSDEGDAKALLIRKPYFQEGKDGYEAVFLLISKKGFYAFSFPARMSSNGEIVISDTAGSHDLRMLIYPSAAVTITTQRLNIYEDEARMYLAGHLKASTDHSLLFSSQDSGVGRLLTEQDEALVRACLEHSFTLIHQEQQILTQQELKAKMKNQQTEGQLHLAQQMSFSISESLPQKRSEGSIWNKWFSRKKKKKNGEG